MTVPSEMAKEEAYLLGAVCPKCGNGWSNRPKGIITDPYVHDEDYMCEKCGHLWDEDDTKMPNLFMKEEDI